MTGRPLPLAISVGDPAGVGPTLALLAASRFEEESFILHGDGAQLRALASTITQTGAAIEIVHAAACPPEAVAAHAASKETGRAQLAALDSARDCVSAGRARALVTGPTSKAAVTMAGVEFRGQTEHLARAVGLEDDDVTMLFLGERLKTGLVTTHHAIRDVPALITAARVRRTAVHLGEALRRLGVTTPEVLVASLNPHAGEGGLFGDEEAKAIEPGIAAARGDAPYRDGAARLTGPIGAETAFRWAVTGRAAGVVAMMHDQATIAAKLVDWGTSVNVTWGLPFVRTSVDHGVAYDAARRAAIDVDGMMAAIRMAQALTL